MNNLEYDIFVSYSRKDFDKVYSVVNYLKDKGFSIWIDQKGIESGDAFASVLVTAIEKSKVVLFFSSESSNVSEWTAREIAVAHSRNKKIIPVKLDNSLYNRAVEMYLILLDYVDLTNSGTYSNMLDRLTHSLEKECSNQQNQQDTDTENNERIRIDINGIYVYFRLVKPGKFSMIRKRGILKDTRVVINITKSFYMAETPVTINLYKSIMGSKRYVLDGDYTLDEEKYGELPESMVSLKDWTVFINSLNTLTQKQFRIPTEAEWEYAAKGGHKSKGYKYSGSNDIDKVAWYNTKEDYPQRVGLKFPNELGLFDMCGNVYEICSDWYTEDLTLCDLIDPQGPKTGEKRVIRGGAWCESASHMAIENSENRYYVPDLGFISNKKCGILGLRLVLDV